jgi:hypothetical protein
MNKYKSLAEKLSHFHFVHNKLTWNGPGLSLGHHLKRSAASKLSHGIATEDSSPISSFLLKNVISLPSEILVQSLAKLQTATLLKL